MSRHALICVLFFALWAPVGAQTTQSTLAPPPAVRDPQAVALVQQAIAAMGGNAITQLQNAQVQGTLTPVANSSAPSGPFTWTDDFSGSSYEFRHELDATDATRVLVSGHGSPGFQKAGKLKPLRSHVTYTALPYHLPGILLARTLANTDWSITSGGQVTVEGRPAVQIILKLNTDAVARVLSEQRWDFEVATGLPMRVEYRLPSTIYPSDSIPAAVEFTNYQVVSGVAVPFQITSFEDGAAVSVATISSVSFNVSVPSSLYDLAGGPQ